MSILTVERSTYKVDPLYQWDVGQVLEIYGLSLARTPEVHFWQSYMSLAIVKPATMDAAGVVRVTVPDALLQKAYPLRVFVCIDTGNTFTTVKEFSIPVTQRARPADYAIDENEELADEVKYTLAQLVAAAQDSASAAAASASQAANSAAAAQKATADCAVLVGNAGDIAAALDAINGEAV